MLLDSKLQLSARSPTTRSRGLTGDPQPIIYQGKEDIFTSRLGAGQKATLLFTFHGFTQPYACVETQMALWPCFHSYY